MTKYNLAQILEAWEAAYGEDMMTEYPGFIQRLSEENASQASNPGKGSDTHQFGARTKRRLKKRRHKRTHSASPASWQVLTTATRPPTYRTYT